MPQHWLFEGNTASETTRWSDNNAPWWTACQRRIPPVVPHKIVAHDDTKDIFHTTKNSCLVFSTVNIRMYKNDERLVFMRREKKIYLKKIYLCFSNTIKIIWIALLHNKALQTVMEEESGTFFTLPDGKFLTWFCAIPGKRKWCRQFRTDENVKRKVLYSRCNNTNLTKWWSDRWNFNFYIYILTFFILCVVLLFSTADNHNSFQWKTSCSSCQVLLFIFYWFKHIIQ